MRLFPEDCNPALESTPQSGTISTGPFEEWNLPNAYNFFDLG
jgi:hypothetical protein